jgi:C4-dicarboxylate transporter/malic acid transport protein
MTTTAPAPGTARAGEHWDGRRLMPALERPSDALRYFGPNWFAAVMGTGIVANAAASLPFGIPGLHALALCVWLLGASLLVVLLAATTAHWLLYPEQARSHVRHPVASHFYGAPPMAMLTVGAGALLIGKDLIGSSAALGLDWVLWVVGTATGLASAAVVPYFAFTRHAYKPDSAFGGWLMPIVPPMVSASTGALLVPHLPPGQARASLLLACYAMFGLSLIASLVVIPQIWGRLVQHKVGAAAAVPTLWIVLGPLGQSITAANLLGTAAGPVLPAPYGQAAAALGLFYGVITWGFAALWLAIAAAITLRTARQHLPFSLTWWSFTFPVGTLVTGSSALALRTGLDLFSYPAMALYAFLLIAWATVLLRTTRGAIRGHLFLPPESA